MKKALLCLLMIASFSANAEKTVSTENLSVDKLQRAFEQDLRDILTSPDVERTKEILVRHRKTVECIGMFTNMNETVFMNVIYDFEKMLRDPVIRQLYLKQLSAIDNITMGWNPDETSCKHVQQ